MWQTVMVVVIVAAAAFFVGRRFWRGVSGRGPACGCGPNGAGDCSTCGQTQHLTLKDLTPPPGGTCPHCAPDATADRPASESEDKP
jgi:hypothetical protein